MSWEATRATVGELVDQGIAEVLTGPFGTQLRASDYGIEGTPVLNVRNLGYGSVRTAKIERAPTDVQERLRSHLLLPGDILFGRKGAVDRHVLVTPGQAGWMQGSDCIRLRLRVDAPVLPAFLSKLLLTEEHKRWMEGQCSHGATMASLNQEIIRRIEIDFPSISRQRRVLAVLLACDELIEINERRIDVLEGMAQAYFRQVFPTVLESSQSDGTFASDLIAVNPKVTKGDGPYPRVTMADVGTAHSHVLPSSVTTRFSGSKFQRGDVLMARITPSLENGKMALALFLDSEEVGVGSTEFIVLRGKEVGPAFVYCAAREPYFRGHAIRSMGGASGRQRVAPECFDTLAMAEPSGELEAEFELTVMPMLELVLQLRKENDALASAHDRLLPRLVAGQLDISDIDLGVLIPKESE